MSGKAVDKSKLLNTKFKAEWISEINEEMVDDSLKKIINFFLVKSICKGTSSLGCTLDEYGWIKKDYHKGGYLENKLLSDAALSTGDNFLVFESREQELESFRKLNMDGESFYMVNDPCRMVLISSGTIINSICKHIRNSIAHCRIAITGENNDILIFEDGSPKGDSFEVKARMILTKTILINWIDTIKHEAERRHKREEIENKEIDKKVISYLLDHPNTTFPTIAKDLGIEKKLIGMSTRRLRSQHIIENSTNKGWHYSGGEDTT